MALSSLDMFQVPIYGLVAGAIVITSLLKVAQLFQRWKYARDNGCRALGHSVSHGLFGIGILKELTKAAGEHGFLELIRSWHRHYGTTFKASVISRKIIFTVEPKNIQSILALKFNDFDLGETRRAAVRPVFGLGIFSLDGTMWEHARALIRPTFTRAQINNTQLYETHVTELIKHIPRDGSTVDLLPLFFKGTLDTASQLLLGESAHSLSGDETSESVLFGKNFDLAQEVTSLRFKFGRFAMLQVSRKHQKAIKDTRAYVEKFAQKAIDYRNAVNSGQDVDKDIKQLTENQNVFAYEISKQTLDKTEITDQLLNLLLAGRDTTASLLAITFFVLARQPEVWNKLRKEILTLDGQKPSFEDVKSMTYLTWVLNETQRLYPVVPFNQRQAIRDTHLPVGGGPDGKSPVHVPKGYDVIWSTYTMYRDNSVYGPDAAEFRPERWANLRPGWAYLPFHGGPRICIGQQFALTEAGYTVVRILQEFESIESRDPSPWVEDLKLTLLPANGTKVALTPVRL
ncbi:hypothetical protein VN97_g10345 [Penicillium thymicola]|uniref:Uncharacterized protein n=1 Tax=Penicillium thymicola TaxID=293382 RepID=A0AAI9T955_PENTH|nr:hypothetical protein VN97_g10345 [Penicillium thymicola]